MAFHKVGFFGDYFLVSFLLQSHCAVCNVHYYLEANEGESSELAVLGVLKLEVRDGSRPAQRRSQLLLCDLNKGLYVFSCIILNKNSLQCFGRSLFTIGQNFLTPSKPLATTVTITTADTST